MTSRYTITVRVYQTDSRTYYRVVEKTCWKYAAPCVWSEVDGTHVLTMGTSGTCGSLRFLSNTGEYFIVTLGAHHYRWCDIVPNLAADETGVFITPQYYDDNYPDREAQRERQLAAYSVSDYAGRKLTVSYSVAEGYDLTANVVIG
ncbi:fungal fruit body lectin [Lactifluus volemus]|nr:fungal fruit body lectin [Lactifluus volemus]